MTADPHLERQQFAASAQACARKLHALARVALRREAPRRFTEAISDAAEKVERAIPELDRGGAPRERSLQLVSGRVARRLVHALEHTEAELRDAGDAPPPARERTVPSIAGHTGSLSSADLLDLLGQHGKTGELRLELAAETVTIGLLQGRVVNAISSASPEGDRLGDVLVQHNILSEGQLQRTVRAAQVVGRRLGSLLLGGDMITREQLRLALEEQVRRLFERVYAADDARFEFREGPVDEDESLDLDLRRLLLESVLAAHGDEDGGQALSA